MTKAQVPARVLRAFVHFPPATSLARAASVIAEAAWRDDGVRVFRWPCGTLVVASIGSAAEDDLVRTHGHYLLATWAQGATLREVLDELRWARRHA